MYFVILVLYVMHCARVHKCKPNTWDTNSPGPLPRLVGYAMACGVRELGAIASVQYTLNNVRHFAPTGIINFAEQYT